jgi:hypothetical protein
MQYLSQKAAPWVSGLVLISGLAIACMFIFLQRVSVQASESLVLPTDVDNYNWVAPHQ